MANLSDLKFGGEKLKGSQGPQGLTGITGITGPFGSGIGPFQVSTITSPHTLSTNEIGKLVKINETNAGVSTVGLNTITIPTSTFSLGDTFLIFNETSPTQTIKCGVGVTFYSTSTGTGTTIGATIPQNGLCTVLCLNQTEFTFSGNFDITTGPPLRGLIGNGTARVDPLAANLQLAYPFSDAANGTDYSGNNRNLSASGTPTEYSISGVDINGDLAPYTTSYGKTSGNLVNTWTLPSSTYNFKSGNITVECWFYYSSLDTTYPLVFVNYFSSQSEGSFGVNTNLSISSNAYLGFNVQTATNIITRNSWNHVAYTRDTSTAPDTHRIYVNGTLQATVTSDSYGNAYSTNQFCNQQYGGGGGAFGNPAPNSFIMDFRVYNTVKYTSNFDIRNYLPILIS